MAATVLLAACGGDDKKSSSKGAKATVLKITASQPASGQYRIDIPASFKGGLVKIEFHNADKVVREAQLLRLEGGHTIDEALRGKPPVPDWQNVAGGVADTKPGQTSTAIQDLPAGRYYVLDTNREGKDAPRYYTKGALAPLQVTGVGKPGDLPDTTATIRITDRSPGFVARGLKSGSNTVLIDNISSQPYGVAIEPILPGKTLDDVRTYLKSGQSGPSPFDDSRTMYTAQIEGSKPDQVTQQVVQLHLPPGRYAVTSYITDRADVASPADKGFAAGVDVTGPALSKDEFIAKGDAICARYARERDAAEKPFEPPDTVAKLAQQDAAGVPASEKLISEFGALQPPDDAVALKEHFLDRARKRLDVTKARIAAARKNDTAALGEANEAIQQIRTPVMSEYGFKECGPGKGG